MAKLGLRSMSKARLRWLLGSLFLALLVPSVVLVLQANRQLKWESFHHHHLQAEDLTAQIDRELVRLVRIEDRRPFSSYVFPYAASAMSPLSRLPIESELPGLIGYFQIDPEGRFSTPLLPEAGRQIGEPDYAQRLAVHRQIESVLLENALVGRESAAHAAVDKAAELARPRAFVEYDVEGEAAQEEVASSVVPQAAFDRLNAPARERKAADEQSYLGRVEDLKLDATLENRSQVLEKTERQSSASYRDLRQKRKEQAVLSETGARDDADQLGGKGSRVRTFESEIDPFEFSLLDSGHLVLFRWVWRDQQRYVQGALLNQAGFLEGVMAAPFRDGVLAGMSDLLVAYQGNVLRAFDEIPPSPAAASALSGSLLYRNRLSAPFADLELLFSVHELPAGPGARVISWAAAVMGLVLFGGFLALYRLGARQLALAGQQQDFVSAVSHELKTPLTTIRMYGEMLREGWVEEAKRKTYYDFIFHESERLSRLINNVLQLARLTRNRYEPDQKTYSAAELIALCRPKIGESITRAGFELIVDCPEDAGAAILLIDADCFSQILINLIDNAIKFAADSERKDVEVSCRRQIDGTIRFSVRDYGPGIAKDQMKKIFELFYRPEGGLTRETAGTGIGLALVRQLCRAMDGRVDVRNCEPGAEFSVEFPGTS
jgi:signal transduction histidine kinase